jgi:hypothetical protein
MKQSRPTIETRIGRRIRRLRHVSGLSLDAVPPRRTSRAALLSKVENARVSSPIADALPTSRTALDATGGLSSSASTNESRCVVVRRAGAPGGRGDGIAVRLSRTSRSATSGVDKRMEPFLVTYPAGVAKPPRFSHRGEAFLYVLKGRIEFQHDATRSCCAGRQRLLRQRAAPRRPRPRRQPRPRRS